MFLLIVDRRWDDLLNLGRTLRSNGHRSLALLSFDYAFTFLLVDRAPETDAVRQVVADFTIFPMFCAYAALVKSHRDEARTSQVFGIEKGPSDCYILPHNTLLYESAAHANTGLDIHVITGIGGITVALSALLRLLRKTLDNRLHSRFSAFGKACKAAQILQPCLSYHLSADCVDTKSCRWSHQKGPRHPYEQEIHLRIRFLCEVIIANGMLDASARANSVWEARYVSSFIGLVLGVAFTICFPSPGRSGCICSLTPSTSHSSRWARPSCSTRSLYPSSQRFPGF